VLVTWVLVTWVLVTWVLVTWVLVTWVLVQLPVAAPRGRVLVVVRGPAYRPTRSAAS
jgi:hypothetical protein